MVACLTCSLEDDVPGGSLIGIHAEDADVQTGLLWIAYLYIGKHFVLCPVTAAWRCTVSLADLKGLGVISVRTSGHAAEKPGLPLENLRAVLLGQQDVGAHSIAAEPLLLPWPVLYPD
jgi:hypothetical protein